jgi:hypothetical protein
LCWSFWSRAAATAAPAPTAPAPDGSADHPFPRQDEVEPFGYAAYRNPEKESGEFLPLPDRWRIGFPSDYRRARGNWFDPYNQNALKGDYPILGSDDKFLIVTATSDTIFEARNLPVPSGVSSLEPGSQAFFGAGEQFVAQQNFILTLELFQGDSVYRPRDWELRLTPVFQFNYAQAAELQLTDVDVREGRDRTDEQLAFQELFVEKHLLDLSANYDVLAVRAGHPGLR